MRRTLSRWIALAAASTCTLSLGCAFATDIFNPGLLSSVGLDPARFLPAPGSVVVAFTNNLPVGVTFVSIKASDAADLTIGARVIETAVDANSTISEVLDCPIGLFSPGSLTNDFQRDPVAAFVTVGDGVEEVQYANAALLSSRDFTCGDLINVIIGPAANEAGIAITIRVVPGR
ncbi:MAG: hypothetical protein HRU75_03040 [Planctomycetia bacterium]|nr:MAG: hypothetical protein HRU75_03040 [Planctomycetia bacterium]